MRIKQSLPKGRLMKIWGSSALLCFVWLQCWAHPQLHYVSFLLHSRSRSHRTALLTNHARSATGNLLSHLTGIINSIPSQISLSSQQQPNDVPSSQTNNSATTPVIIEATTEPSHVTLPHADNHHLHHVHVSSSAAIEINSPSARTTDNDHQSKIQIGDVHQQQSDGMKKSKTSQNHQHDNNGLITIVTINNRNSDNVNSIVWNQKNKIDMQTCAHETERKTKKSRKMCVIKYSTNPPMIYTQFMIIWIP